MKKALERFPFFLLLLPAFVVVHLEKELHRLINYKFVFERIIIFFTIPLFLFAVFYFLLRSFKKAALFSFCISLFIYFLGDIKNRLSEKFPGALFQKYYFLFIISFVILALIFIVLGRNKTELKKTFLLINTGLLLFIFADATSIIINGNKPVYPVSPVALNENTPCSDCMKPDIYYIIFDSYASSPALLADYGYSNHAMENDLKQKGFVILPNSRSNYNYTAFSLGSVFNMNYFENVDTVNKLFDRKYLQALKTVYNNQLIPFLEKEGYRIFNHSLFDFKNYPTTQNRYDKWGIRELFDQYNIFFKFTYDAGYNFPGWIVDNMLYNPYFINHRQTRQYSDSTVKVELLQSLRTQTEQPKFVYAHFLYPHPPFFNDSTGNPLSTTNSFFKEDIKTGYIHQVASVNRTIKEITDSIITQSKGPLIIIIQGDHGYSYETEFNRKIPRMFLNLNAICFSNKDYRLLNDSLTNVNTFRVVLNTWFNKDLPILPNKFYFLK